MKKVNYATHLSNTKSAVKAEKTLPVHGRPIDVPQTEQLREDQVQNSAGGFVFEASASAKLDRFLILGAEGGTFYNSEKKLTVDAAKNVQSLIQKNGVAVVNRVVEISQAGRAIKNDPALFVLALCASSGDPITVKAAFAALPQVARIGTHLFTFAEYANELRGWGKAMKSGFANWYNTQELDKLAYGALKYQHRNGWRHRDLFRLAHIKTDDVARNALYRFIVRGEQTDGVELPGIVNAYQKVQADKTVASALAGIESHNLSFEMIPTELLKDQRIWEAMLPKMGLTAMIRNLGKMSAIGMLGNLTDSAKQVIARLSDADQLRKARVHPVALLCALKVYSSGHGQRGGLSWNVNSRIVSVLDDAFYGAFKFVPATGKTILQAVDCSGSMFGNSVVGAAGMDAATGAAVMAMVTARVEQNSLIVGFGSSRVDTLPITPNMRLDQVMEVMNDFNWGGTDCALPIKFADKNNMKIDVFTNYTDNETWAGPTHPSVALTRYRAKYGINSKLAVIGMCVNDFTIADPQDPLQLDLVGFDTSTPAAIAELAML